jgi:outer membrane receptor protein involved in Fe transport
MFRRAAKSGFLGASALSALLLSTAAYAQAGPPAPPQEPAGDASEETAPDGSIQEIVVTAQKRSEVIQDVPIAISAFTADTIERRGLDDVLDLQLLVPNLLVVGNDRPTLRGIGNNALSFAENGTGSLVNFAPIAFRSQDEYFDVERVEVLRGPQGTLYGRNTTGGTINVITQKPRRDFGGYLTAQYGSFDTRRLNGAVNLPVSDALQFRFAGFYLKRDGYTENLGIGPDVDGRDQWSLRGSMRVNLGPDTRLDLMVNRSEEDSTRTRENKRLCKATPVLGCSPVELGFDSPDTSGVLMQTLLGALNAFVYNGTLFTPGASIYAGAQNPADLRQVSTDYTASFKGKQTNVTLELSHDLGPVTLLSLSAYSKGRSDARTDFDNALLPFRFTTPITYNVDRETRVTTDQLLTSDAFVSSGRAYYQEFRAVSDFNGMFDFTAGVNFFDSKGAGAFQIYHPAFELFGRILRAQPPEGQFFNAETRDVITKSFAVFGETYFQISDATKLTFGLRYTEDKKSQSGRTIIPFVAGIPAFTTLSGKYDAVTGRAVVDHKLTRDNLIYASFARGFKAGGVNPAGSAQVTIAPEYINAYEIGSKNQFLNDRLQANFSAFYYDYKDLQLGQRRSTATQTINTDATIWGLESEFLLAPVRGLLLNVNASYLNTRLGGLAPGQETSDPANPAQWNPALGAPTKTPEVRLTLKGNELPYAPKYKLALGGEYTAPIGGGWSLTGRADHSWQSRYFAREFNTSNDRIKAWSITNALVRLQNERFSLEGYIRNAFNKDNITNSIIESDLIGSYRNARILEPRTIGVIGSVRF